MFSVNALWELHGQRYDTNWHDGDHRPPRGDLRVQHKTIGMIRSCCPAAITRLPALCA